MAHRFVARSSLGDFPRDAVLASADRLVVALAALAYFLVGMLKFDRVIVAALLVLLPAPDVPWHHRPVKRARSLDAFPTNSGE